MRLKRVLFCASIQLKTRSCGDDIFQDHCGSCTSHQSAETPGNRTLSTFLEMLLLFFFLKNVKGRKPVSMKTEVRGVLWHSRTEEGDASGAASSTLASAAAIRLRLWSAKLRRRVSCGHCMVDLHGRTRHRSGMQSLPPLCLPRLSDSLISNLLLVTNALLFHYWATQLTFDPDRGHWRAFQILSKFDKNTHLWDLLDGLIGERRLPFFPRLGDWHRQRLSVDGAHAGQQESIIWNSFHSLGRSKKRKWRKN